MAKTSYITDIHGRRYVQTEYETDDVNSSSSSSGTDDEASSKDSDTDEDLVVDNNADEEEEEVQPAPTRRARDTRAKSQSRSESRSKGTNSTTPAPAKRRSNPKTNAVTPRTAGPTDEIQVGRTKDKDISPISDELRINKNRRREESLHSMSSTKENDDRDSRDKRNRDKHKRKRHELEEENKAKDEELKRLKEQLQQAQNGQQADVPVPKSRASNKKRRNKIKKEKPSVSRRGVSLDSFVKKAAKAQFRHTKFVKDLEQFRKRVGDHVMDQLEIDELHHKADESELDHQKVERYRDDFFNEWSGVMATGFNEARNYRQSRVKDACIAWLVDNKKTELFPTEDLEKVMLRDFADVEPEINEDGEQISPGDPDKLAYYHELFDFYVDKLLPAVAGANNFNEGVRHFVPVSEAKFTESDDGLGGKLIVTPGMEALVLLFFKNARRKWELMYDHEYVKGFTNKKLNPFPTWSPKKPEENKEWKTVYSNPASGQDPFGGWKASGLKENSKLLKVMKEVRDDVSLCLFQEKLAVERLYKANKEMHEKGGNKPKPVNDGEENVDDLELEFEDDDI